MSACIVTGAAAGNGLAIALKLHEDGHYVVGVDNAAIPESVPFQAIQGSVLDPEIIDRAFSAAVVRAQSSVFLINNAGVTLPEFPQSDAVWQETLDVNLTAPFRWSRYFAELVSSGGICKGGIVFIGSLATVMGFPRNPAYQSSKSGVLGLTRAFAYDLGNHGIRVNCVSPGYIATAMTKSSYNDPELNAFRRRHTLLNRWGQPQDVANAVAFLCGDSSTYITGINLPVDGGWMVCGLVEGA